MFAIDTLRAHIFFKHWIDLKVKILHWQNVESPQHRRQMPIKDEEDAKSIIEKNKKPTKVNQRTQRLLQNTAKIRQCFLKPRTVFILNKIALL